MCMCVCIWYQTLTYACVTSLHVCISETLMLYMYVHMWACAHVLVETVIGLCSLAGKEEDDTYGVHVDAKHGMYA